MINKYFIILFFLIFSFNLSSQVPNNDSIELKNLEMQQLTGEKYDDPGYKHVNIYFKDYWLPGSIEYVNGRRIENLALKYNGSNNQVIMLSTSAGQIKLDDQDLLAFHLRDKHEIYDFYRLYLDTLNYNSDLFYQHLYSGKIKIYAYRNVKPDAINYRDDGMYRIYTPRPVYIIFTKNHTLFIEKLASKKIFGMYPSLLKLLKDNHRDYPKKFTEPDFFKFLIKNEELIYEL